jgi:pimeloyl-ACP methyl ester carboxylesterase
MFGRGFVRGDGAKIMISMHYLYLHGFASGSHSRKAQAFRSTLASLGIELAIPELDGGDFEHLTIRGQLSVIERTLRGEPARIAGSSMGGYVAALYASSHPEVERLVLLAPAFSFSERWGDMLGPEGIESWRESGWLEVYHYGDQRTRRVHYGLFEDSLRHPPNPDFDQAASIFHGVRDTVVPIGHSRAYAARHPNAQLTELDSDHELLNSLGPIAELGAAFLMAGSI